MTGISTSKLWQRHDAMIRCLVLICMMLLHCACMNQNNGDGPVLKAKASEVFKDPAVARLAEAAARGDRQTVLELVQQGVDVNTRGDLGIPVLEWAFLSQNTDGMLALLEAGADPALMNDKGYTVMHYAAGIENPKSLQVLLDAGVSPDLRNAKGRTPIFEAIWHDREPQFRALIAAGADLDAQELIVNELGHPTGNRPLHRAAKLNDVKRVLVLLEAGANPRAVDGFDETFQYHMNVLKESIATDEFIEYKRKIEAWLVEHGVELELEREHASTADVAQADNQALP